jgi:hypothetical protein
MTSCADPVASEAPVFVKLTQDGRRVEVLRGMLCLDGRPEAEVMVPLDEHPNRQAILRAVPDATHMAGRLPLTQAQASVAQAAIRRANDRFDGTQEAARERMRAAVWQKSMADGAE